MKQPLTIAPGKKVRLADFDPAYTGGLKKGDRVNAELEENLQALDKLCYRLYAEGQRSLLIVLQAMDTGGKDGTIRHAMRAFNPQTCNVVAFKTPSAEELSHDFLWRIHKAVPAKGRITIFNRSHYEDVLIVRVHKLVPRKDWESRYERINAFEEQLVQSGTTIVKFFLHISKDEQQRRLQARLDDPDKRWKFSLGDLEERKLWDDYQQAYEAAVTQCNTPHAPWQIVPADRKWYRNLIVSRVLLKTLEKMDPKFPPPPDDLDGVVVE